MTSPPMTRSAAHRFAPRPSGYGDGMRRERMNPPTSPPTEFVDDPAAEQLYDELFARGWSMHRLVPDAVPSPESVRVQRALSDQAIATVAVVVRALR